MNYICYPMTDVSAIHISHVTAPTGGLHPGDIVVLNEIDKKISNNFTQYEATIPTEENIKDTRLAIVINGGFEMLSDGRLPSGQPCYTQYEYQEGESVPVLSLAPDITFYISDDCIDGQVANGNFLFGNAGSRSLIASKDKPTSANTVVKVLQRKPFRIGGKFGDDCANGRVCRVVCGGYMAPSVQPPDVGVELPTPIIVDVNELGFDVNEMTSPTGSTIDITNENKTFFEKLGDSQAISHGVYLLHNGDYILLVTREYSSKHNAFVTIYNGVTYSLDIGKQVVTLKAIKTITEINDTYISEHYLMHSKKIVDNITQPVELVGRIVRVENPVSNYPLELSATITPVQQGVGEASPTNERTISGWDSVTFNVANHEVDNGAHVDFGRVVYGGLYHADGRLEITMASRTFNGTEGWRAVSIPNGRNSIFQLVDETFGANTNTSVQMCSTHKCRPETLPAWTFDGVWMAGNQVNVGGSLTSQYSDINAWKAELARTPMQIVYELETPIVVDTDTVTIYTVAGENTIEASTGDVIVKVPLKAKTPVKGVDYFTPDDINEIVTMVVEQLRNQNV